MSYAEEHLEALLREIAEFDVAAAMREVVEAGEAMLREAGL